MQMLGLVYSVPVGGNCDCDDVSFMVGGGAGERGGIFTHLALWA